MAQLVGPRSGGPAVSTAFSDLADDTPAATGQDRWLPMA